MADMLKVRALLAKRNAEMPLYSFYIKGSDILKVADISRIKRGDADELIGYQRNEVRRHVDEITDYFDKSGVLTNAIILAISSDAVFKQSRGPKVGDQDVLPGVLEIPIGKEGKKSAWIVDGQQRTIAITKSKTSDTQVPVTAFVSDDFDVHRTQFLLVNKVKPLPSGLINELLPEVNTELPPSLAKNKIPSALCNVLNKDPESPFKGLIARQTTDRRVDKMAVITDRSLIDVIRNSMNGMHGCLYPYKNVATGQIDAESIRKVLNLYWGVVSELFPNAWGEPPSKSRLMHGVGIKSMGILMDRVMTHILPTEENARQKIKENLSTIVPYCAWTKGRWEKLNDVPWNFLQNTQAHVKLLSNMLIRVYTGVEQ
jgi:DGQHR domain-containing protein